MRTLSDKDWQILWCVVCLNHDLSDFRIILITLCHAEFVSASHRLGSPLFIVRMHNEVLKQVPHNVKFMG